VMTPGEREEDERLNRAIVELNKRMRDEEMRNSPDGTLLKDLGAQLYSARLKYESFRNVLYAAHPGIDVRRDETPPLTLDGLGSFLRDRGTAFLEYVVTKERVYLFVLTGKDGDGGLDLRVYPVNIKESDLAEKAGKFRQMMADRQPVFADLSRELYDLLVKPAEEQLRGGTTLCIIPDGPLWDIPFQALRSKAYRYLLEDYAIYYAVSLGVLREMGSPKGRTPKNDSLSLIAFGNSAPGKGAAGGALPEAGAEVTAIERIFGQERARALTGAGASERAFKSLAPAYRMIHVATHGVLDNAHPLYSYLLLSKTEGDASSDGFLEAREIMNLDLDADLAVLSACETARGRVGAGEGVIGMSWAFFLAGCRATIVSQWKVHSAGTSQLMVNFYKHLKAGDSLGRATKAEALRQAALELMRDGRYSHPFYWAGFVMVGNNHAG
jgi:CHAT domain-containing protein